MRPLLAHVYEPHRVTYPCYVQPKLNGIRALYQAGSFQSRDELPFPTGLLAHLAGPLRACFSPEVILDGELYVHGWPLQRILSAVTPVTTQRGPTEDTRLVEYHVFDAVDYNKPFIARFPNAWLLPKEIKLVGTPMAVHEGHANEFYAKWVAEGYEGMMYRLGDCPYTVPKQKKVPLCPTCKTLMRFDIESTADGNFTCMACGHRVVGHFPKGFLSDKNNRCWHLLKRKDFCDDEFPCVAVIEGVGKRHGLVGSFICETPSGRQFGVGGGFTDAEGEFYLNNPPIGRRLKVKYLTLSSDGIPTGNTTLLAVL